MMNRRSFCTTLVFLGSVCLVSLDGCGRADPPKDPECAHEWEKAPSGDTRCKKCGTYQK